MTLEQTDAVLSDALDQLVNEFYDRLARLIEDALVAARDEGFEEGVEHEAEWRGEA